MADRLAMVSPPLHLLSEPLATTGTPFANAPAPTRLVVVTIKSGTMSVTFDGSTPTASNSHDYTPGRYELYLSNASAAAIKSIGTFSGYTTYLGL